MELWKGKTGIKKDLKEIMKDADIVLVIENGSTVVEKDRDGSYMDSLQQSIGG